MTCDVYLHSVDASGRIIRTGKRGHIDPQVIAVLDRLRLDVDAWLSTMRSGRAMRGTGLGRATACGRGEAERDGLGGQRLRAVRRGVSVMIA